MRRRCWALLLPLALACFGVGRSAGAQGSVRASLDVTRGRDTASCIDGRALELAVERRLERSVFAPANEGVALRVELALERFPGPVWSAKVVLRDRRGAELGGRDLRTQAAHCSVLDDSLALVIALLVDSPEAREQASSETPPPVPPTTPAPTPAARLTIPPDTLAAREPYRFVLGASLAAVIGPLPGVALGPELLLAVRPPHFVELRLRGAFFPEQHVDLAAPPERGGTLSLVQVNLDVCPLEVSRGRLRFSGCLGQSVGWRSAHGFGFLQNETASSLVYSLGVGAGARWVFADPVLLSVSLGAAVPLARDTYVAKAADGSPVEVFRSGVVTGVATAGLGLEL